MGVDDAGDARVVDVPVSRLDVLDGGDTLVLGLVGCEGERKGGQYGPATASRDS